MTRGRPRKNPILDDPNASPEVKDKVRQIEEDRQRKENSYIVDQWYEIKEKKVLYFRKVNNGNTYSSLVCNNSKKNKDEIDALKARKDVRIIDRTA